MRIQMFPRTNRGFNSESRRTSGACWFCPCWIQSSTVYTLGLSAAPASICGTYLL